MVGAYAGYPQLGFVLGSLAGSALFPTQLPSGPRIQDNRTTTSVVGGPISLLLGGTANCSGTVMWLAPYVEHKMDASQKGGPSQTTFNYTQSIALGLAERVDDDAPDDEGAIGGLTRIWENGAIVYDIRPQQQANSFLNTLAETDEQYADRLTASAAYASTFTLYLGDELQQPDPTIEAYEGVGLTPPFRGHAYIVYTDRALSIAQGLRHPNFQFEVFNAGIGNCVETPVKSNVVLHPWLGGSAGNPINILNTMHLTILFFDTNLPSFATWPFATIYPSETDVRGALRVAGYPTVEYLGYGWTAGGNDELVQAGGAMVTDHMGGTPDPTQITIEYNFRLPLNGYYSNAQRVSGFPSPRPVGLLWHRSRGVAGDIVVQTADDTGPPISPYPTREGDGVCTFADATVLVERSPSAPTPICAGLTPSTIPGYAVRTDGKIVKCNPWVLTHDPGGSIKVLQVYVGASPNCVYPLNPCLGPEEIGYSDATFWTNAYTAAVAAGSMAAGKIYGTDYPVLVSDYFAIDQVICEGSGAAASVGEMIRAICKRSGLREVDTSDIDDVLVDGYMVSTICSGQAMITPLRALASFDAVDTNAQLKFAGRGKPVVATFTTDDFGAYDVNQGGTDASGASSCPPSITTTRSQDEDLPRSIRLHYIATSRDYEDAEQPSPSRLNTKAVNDVDISVAVCLSDEFAAQRASVLWADAWAAQTAYELSVDQSKLQIDVADCIAVPVDNFIERMRIANDTNSSGVLRKLSCVKDAQGAYISFAVASPPQRAPQRLTFVGATSYELLDLPCLQDADSDPGFYVAAQRSGGGTWKGATFYKSTDGGATFASLFSLLTESTMGVIVGAVPQSQAYTWDDETLIVVNVPDPRYSFESVTDDAVLAGANAAAMGADGRWEIVQFATAVQIAPTLWNLSRLLRGRRGTEHVIGSSQTGDTFVLLKAGALGRVVLDAAEIGAARVYRGTSIGASFSSGVTESFSGHGRALVCFSPVQATAQRLSDGDVSIAWIRRSRLGRTLMSGVDIPLGEASESFQVDILEDNSPASPEIVLRTLASSTTSVLYSHANQVTDFGSPLPVSIRVAIYQLSAITGRGTPELVTLTIT